MLLSSSIVDNLHTEYCCHKFLHDFFLNAIQFEFRQSLVILVIVIRDLLLFHHREYLEQPFIGSISFEETP
jgi:hypothetical protein